MCTTSVRVTPKNVTLKRGDWFHDAVAEVESDCPECAEVSWYSINPTVASVHPTSGYIQAVGIGSTKIYAEATDGSECADYLIVKVVSGDVPVSCVQLSHETLVVEKGQCKRIVGGVCPENATNKELIWTSADTSIATVSGGVVKGISQGSTKITATAADGSGKCASCTVKVTGNTLVTSIELEPSNTVLKVGYSFFPRVTVCPTNATNKSVTWSSANSNIAFVNPDSGLVHAKTVGTTTIYATACDGSEVYGCCTVKVIPVYVQDIVVCPKTLTLDVGDRSCLEATVYPVNATNQNVSWISENCNIADVDANGCVTAKSAGTTYIYADAIGGSGVYDCCKIVVTQTLNALKTLERCYVRLNTSGTTTSILEKPNEQGEFHDVILEKDDTVYLLDTEAFSDANGGSWYKILYDGMMVYVTNDGSFEKIALPSLPEPSGRTVTVNTGDPGLDVRCTPSIASDELGRFADGTTVLVTNEIPQNDQWYAVYGQLTDGSYSYGWCLGEKITIATSIYEKTLNVRATPDSVNGTILGSISNGEEVRLITKNAITNNYTWHKILFNNLEAYVIAGQNSPNFTFETCVELRNSEITNDDDNTNGYIGDYQDFLQILAYRESSNNYTAVNGSYLGKYQMGSLALQDAGFMNTDGDWTSLANSYNVNSKNDFLNNNVAQEVAVVRYHKKIWGYIVYYKLIDKIGQMYQNVRITESGLVAAIHLIGIGDIIEAINNNTPVADGNGTTASDYMNHMANYDMSEIK